MLASQGLIPQCSRDLRIWPAKLSVKDFHWLLLSLSWDFLHPFCSLASLVALDCDSGSESACGTLSAHSPATRGACASVYISSCTGYPLLALSSAFRNHISELKLCVRKERTAVALSCVQVYDARRTGQLQTQCLECFTSSLCAQQVLSASARVWKPRGLVLFLDCE